MKKKSPQDSNSTGQEESSSLVSFCRSSVAAGVCIGCAGLIYSRLIGTALGGYVGALCFAAGLYYVVLKGLTLYTGRIGFLSETFSRFALMLIFNFIGAALAAIVANIAYEPEKLIELATKKLALPYMTVLGRAFLCGMAMYFAVDGWKRTNSPFPVVLGVFVFVACGFEHCVADVFYFSAANQLFTVAVWKFTFLAVLGNTLGAIFLKKITD